MVSLVSHAVGRLEGDITVPGDKSISHRALMIAAISVGRSTVEGLLEGEDVLRTAAAMRALGAQVERHENGLWEIHGVGIGGLSEPADVLDMGNSGTAARLLMGLLASHGFNSFITGDSSLRSRPMARVTKPLEMMGARFVTRDGGRLPLAVLGTTSALPLTYRLPVASAQVKSAVLLAGLNAPGQTTVIEPQPTRDHSELMLRHFGVPVSVVELEDGARAVTVTGQVEITGRNLQVPGDPSSAAFPLVAALIGGGGAVTVRNVGMNPLRTGLFQTLTEMGAALTFGPERQLAGERVADITAAPGRLKGVDVPAARAPSMIDEYPILAVAAAFAEGTTRMRGLAELRVKESDRLTAMATGLSACGAKVEIEGDDLIVHGSGGVRGAGVRGGATITTHCDHRIAMSFLVLGSRAEEGVRVDDGSFIDTSFPGFVPLMTRLGADIAPDAGDRL